MKTTIKALLLIAIIITVSFLMPGLMDSTEYSIKAGEAEWSDDGSETGTDAFTVVEIVPYLGMAEIGYLVGGEEPIEEELMAFGSAPGSLQFLGGAISVYRNYTESALPVSGVAQDGWRLARTVATQNGYFENVGNAAGGRYNLAAGDSYIRVANGTGTHRVELNATEPDSAVYTDTWEPTNYKNVKAYFVYGKPTGVTLYNYNVGYEPYSVKRNATHTGNYDYDSQDGSFYLNVGLGEYDVIFIRSYNNTNLYYMMNNYQIVDDNSGDYSFPVRYVAQTGGNYRRDAGNSSGNIFNYDRWNGTWRWVKDDTALSKTNYSTEGTKVWVRNQKVMLEYQFTYKVTLVNNEWFKRLTLGIPSDQIANNPVDVITITPEDLSKPENQHYIDEADMFYINANYGHNNAYIELYETYNSAIVSLPANQKYSTNGLSKQDNLNFAIHDMSWPAVVKTFKKIAGIGTTKAAAVFDSKYYGDAIDGNGPYKDMQKTITVSYSWNQNKATMCNLAKLYIMVYQRNTIDFYNSFLNDQEPNARLITQVSTVINKSGTTGSFVRPDGTYTANSDPALYWNGNTFVPYGLNASGVMTRYTQDQLESVGIVNYNIGATPTDLMNNVLVTNGQDLFTAKFVQPLSVPSDVQEDAVVHVSSVQGTVVEAGSITLGNFTNVITNNGETYAETGGVSYPGGGSVEGPPAPTPEEEAEEIIDDGTDGSGARSYKSVLNIEPTADFASSEASIRAILSAYDVQITSITSTEFNASIEDINAQYDMVFLGSGAGRFNQAAGTTNFNSAALDGNYYFAQGDTKKVNVGGSQNNMYYQGNDITSQKRSELEAFLAAGYPIVLDQKMYAAGDMKYSMDLKAFITNTKKNLPNNFFNLADFYSTTLSVRVGFKSKLRNALNVTRPIINLLQPTLPAGATTNYVYVDPVTDKLTIQFALLPKGVFPSLYQYNAYLYMDDNGDGLFSEAEMLTVISNDGSSWEDMNESRYRSYTYNYNMKDINGILRWKLMIKRDDNELIRSSVTGYAANTNKMDLHILHVRENGSTYNLGLKVNDTASLINKFAGPNKLNDYNLIFHSMTVQEFQQLYTAASPYTTATRATTNRLSGYHMLILDNPTTAIANTYGAVTNIKDEVASNLSIVFTKGALGINNQALYYPATKNSFQDNRSYNYINLNSVTSTNPLYIYSFLNTNGNLAQPATYNTAYLTKANEGALTRYPYQINKAIRIAQNSFANDVTVDYSLATTQSLVGWYCLSDAKSPVVRKAFSTGIADANLYQGMYSTSPNDVKNNYYLFSNGTCYYSGINLATADAIGNDSEMMLFVNTILAAYKSSGRIMSTPPVITYTDPAPDLSNVITATPSYIQGTDFVMKFKITGSSSPMDLLITLDGANPAETWNETVYQVNSGVVGPAIAINNTSKVIANNNTYELKIPIAAIAGTHILSIRATNGQGNVTDAPVTIVYIQEPVVTYNDTRILPGGYLYLDIDYNGSDVITAERLRIEFNVNKAVTNVALTVTSEGESLVDGAGQDVTIYPATDDMGTLQNLTSAPGNNVNYVMYIPVALMKDYSSRTIVVRATDTYGYYGEATVTLLRRSLFPLD